MGYTGERQSATLMPSLRLVKGLNVEDLSSTGSMSLITNLEYVCAACSCGVGMLVPLHRAVRDGAICCDCGATAVIDPPTLERLQAAEALRLQSRVKKSKG